MKTITLGKIIKNENIFDFDYPFIAGYRKIFEEKFIDHYYDREINFLTVDQFKRRLRSRLRDIMPYYIKLYKSENLKYNPLETYYINENEERGNDNEVFNKAWQYNRNADTAHTRNSLTGDFAFHQTDVHDEEGTKDGTLDRDTTLIEGKDFSEVVNMTGHDDTITNTTRSKQNTDNETKNTTENTTYVENVIFTGVVNQDTTTKFSDTPQVNFAISNQNPDSDYATTLTKVHQTTETANNTNTTGTKQVTGSMIDNQTHTENETINTTVDFTTTRNTATDNNYILTNHGTQDDGTHEEDTRDWTQNADYNHHETGNTQQKTDIERFREGQDSSMHKSTSKTDKLRKLSGRKMTSPAELISKWRSTFLNIDLQLIEEFETLFLGVYNIDMEGF